MGSVPPSGRRGLATGDGGRRRGHSGRCGASDAAISGAGRGYGAGRCLDAGEDAGTGGQALPLAGHARFPRARIVQAANSNAAPIICRGLPRFIGHSVLRIGNAIAPDLALKRFGGLTALM